MLFHLPLAGSTFKKVYYDVPLGRVVSKFVPAEDLLVSYNATSLEDTDTIIHVIKMSENDLRKQQVSGFYADVDLGQAGYEGNDIEDKKEEITGVEKSNGNDVHTLLECHCELDIEGFEDRTETGEETGIRLPYIVTIHEDSGKVLAIRRNYGPMDPMKKKKA